MFKNATIYNITSNTPLTAALLEAGAEKFVFAPCGLTQEKSMGWMPPRGQEHGALVEAVGGHLVMRLMVETRSVPAKAIEEAVDLKCAKVEMQTGRKVGKKERREYKDEARLTLLPHAFSSKRAIGVWIDPANGKLTIDSATSSRTDLVTTLVVQLAEGVGVALINTNVAPSALMTNWLLDGSNEAGDDRYCFTIDRSCELKACDESKATVRYTNHDLITDEIMAHVRQGKRANKLGLTFDERVSFTMTEAGTLAGIKFLDVVFEASKDSNADAFDADVTILTGEMSKMIPALVNALGGEFADTGDEK